MIYINTLSTLVYLSFQIEKGKISVFSIHKNRPFYFKVGEGYRSTGMVKTKKELGGVFVYIYKGARASALRALAFLYCFSSCLKLNFSTNFAFVWHFFNIGSNNTDQRPTLAARGAPPGGYCGPRVRLRVRYCEVHYYCFHCSCCWHRWVPFHW